MDYGKRLTQGVGAWLGFEVACNRTGLFSEKQLVSPIGQLLNLGGRTRPEYPHPILAPLHVGSGRKPAIDFVLVDEKDKLKVAVESKWIGATTPSIEKIFWDLIRLEMLANLGVRSFFVLGGRRKKLAKLFAHAAFDTLDNRGLRSPLLRVDHNVTHKTTLGPTVATRVPILRNLFAHYQDLEFPQAIVSQRSVPYPSMPKASDFQIFCWEIKSLPQRQVFRPANSAQYRVSSSRV